MTRKDAFVSGGSEFSVLARIVSHRRAPASLISRCTLVLLPRARRATPPMSLPSLRALHADDWTDVNSVHATAEVRKALDRQGRIAEPGSENPSASVTSLNQLSPGAAGRRSWKDGNSKLEHQALEQSLLRNPRLIGPMPSLQNPFRNTKSGPARAARERAWQSTDSQADALDNEKRLLRAERQLINKRCVLRGGAGRSALRSRRGLAQGIGIYRGPNGASITQLQAPKVPCEVRRPETAERRRRRGSRASQC